MTADRTVWLVAGFAAGLLLTGLPFWRLPYNADVFGDSGVIAGLAGLGIVTAALALSGVAPLKHIFWIMLAAFPAAVALRVIVEVAQDPTDHNLWPFELIITAIVSLAAVIPGLIVGALLRRLKA